MNSVRVEFAEFAWSRLTEQAQEQGLSVADIVLHAVAYYLADLDSGRLASRPLPTMDPRMLAGVVEPGAAAADDGSASAVEGVP